MSCFVPSLRAALKTSPWLNLFCCGKSLIYFMLVRFIHSMLSVRLSREISLFLKTGNQQLSVFTISVFVNLSVECLYCKKKSLQSYKHESIFVFQSQPWLKPSLSIQCLKHQMIVVRAASNAMTTCFVFHSP